MKLTFEEAKAALSWYSFVWRDKRTDIDDLLYSKIKRSVKDGVGIMLNNNEQFMILCWLSECPRAVVDKSDLAMLNRLSLELL